MSSNNLVYDKNTREPIFRNRDRIIYFGYRKRIEESKEVSLMESILWMFERAARNIVRNNNCQLWQQHTHPIHLPNFGMMKQRFNKIHENPVSADFESPGTDWKWSSARDYSQSGYRGVIDLVLLEW